MENYIIIGIIAVIVVIGVLYTVKHFKGEGATASDTYVKLYVNETLAYSGVGYLKLGAEVDHMDIIHCKTAKSSAVYFDDISLSRTEKEYSKD